MEQRKEKYQTRKFLKKMSGRGQHDGSSQNPVDWNGSSLLPLV
jgi:hypothetical protein